MHPELESLGVRHPVQVVEVHVEQNELQQVELCPHVGVHSTNVHLKVDTSDKSSLPVKPIQGCQKVTSTFLMFSTIGPAAEEVLNGPREKRGKAKLRPAVRGLISGRVVETAGRVAASGTRGFGFRVGMSAKVGMVGMVPPTLADSFGVGVMVNISTLVRKSVCLSASLTSLIAILPSCSCDVLERVDSAPPLATSSPMTDITLLSCVVRGGSEVVV